MKVGISLEEWLEDDENLKLWEDGKLTESDKRVLITKFVGSAWEKIFSRSDFSADIYFQRTGCLLTLDGSDDHLVNIEGLKDYKPPFVQLNDAENIEEVPEPAEEPTSDVVYLLQKFAPFTFYAFVFEQFTAPNFIKCAQR